MVDIRESILSRLMELVGALPGFATVARNLADLPDDAVPAIVVMDGDEDVDDGDRHRTRPAARPVIVTMSPSIHAIVGGDSNDLGPMMNAFRTQLIGAVLADPTLLALTLNGRGIAYGGCATGLAADGRRLIGEIGVSFAFDYVLQPSDL